MTGNVVGYRQTVVAKRLRSALRLGKTRTRLGKILANLAIHSVLLRRAELAERAEEGGLEMGRRSITDASGRFSLEVEVHGTVLEDAIDHSNAEEVLKCAFLMALSVLAQDGPWPNAALASMSSFMTDMRTHLIGQLH